MDWLKDQVSILQNQDVSYLDDTLLDGECLRLLPASEYHKIEYDHLRLWAMRHARYCFPTTELIEWLVEKIGGRFAVELGAGKGDLGRHLGIRQTDGFLCNRPEVQLFYGILQQPLVVPGAGIEQFEAVQAVKELKPQVAVASWLMQFISATECTEESQGSLFGANEAEIIENVDCYIHIGNENSHGEKKILAQPHKEFKFPWLVSRAKQADKNVIYVWGK
jgi:hypothetical protein